MTAIDDYIARVLEGLPRTTPLRTQIAVELRGHIAERMANGQPVEAALRQLGDATELAESYLRELPLEPATLTARIAAKAIDVGMVVALVGAVFVLAAAHVWLTDRAQIAPFIGIAALAGGGLGFIVYTVVAEWRTGATIGKRAMGLHVVRESGAPIGLGQAVVRQLPVTLQFFWVDVLFALFTERGQRAFELLSKTRVVRL